MGTTLRWCRSAATAAAVLLVLVCSLPVGAGPIADREGWEVANSSKTYADLLGDLKAAVKAEEMGRVTEAGPTETARSRGVEIPGIRVIGVFRNDFAVRALRASTAAMIEAPIRFYVTEAPDGTGWLSYKRPSFVFSPYADEGGEELGALSEELDAIFARIAERAIAD